MKNRLSRRHALRGVGTLISLPFLEAMLGRSSGATESAKPPVRLVWLYVGSGMYMPAYRPALTGRVWMNSTEFPASLLTPNVKIPPEIKPLATLEPLRPFQDDVTVVSGLLHQGAFRRGTVVRHGQDPMCHLTAVDLFRVPGVAVRNGVSIDQVAARHIGGETRIPFLSLTQDRNLTINYTDTGSPIPAAWNPYDVFQRLFAGPSPADRAQSDIRYQQKKSLLDGVIGKTKKLHGSLGAADRERLDEYLGQLREIELRTAQARKWYAVPLPRVPDRVNGSEGVGNSPDLSKPGSAPMAFGTQIRLLLDVLVLALQTDQTRVATAVLGHMGDIYKEDGLNDSYHYYTHSGPIGMARVDRMRIGHLAYMLGKMKAIKEADGSTLLDNSIVHFGGGMGTWHESTDLANLVAGHGGGHFKLGEHIVVNQQPLANLYLTMLQAAGISEKHFVDSTGALELS